MGASDFIELALAALLLVFALAWRPFIEPHAARLAQSTGWSMLLLAALPVALRLALLPHHPAPVPDIYDEFSHLLVADTLRHLRLANPAHALQQFFETFFVLQQPAYSSIYPVGQGLGLAIGWTLFGTPWAGVMLAVAALGLPLIAVAHPHHVGLKRSPFSKGNGDISCFDAVMRFAREKHLRPASLEKLAAEVKRWPRPLGWNEQSGQSISASSPMDAGKGDSFVRH